MPDPGSKKYDVQRARRRNDLGNSGQEAKQEPAEDPQWRPS